MLTCLEPQLSQATMPESLGRLAGCLLLLVVALGGCGGGSASRVTNWNVVLITIDTLRADHCSAYGYERQTTPFLDELASRSTVFENAYATSSWTAPSMASLFTALYPRSHGVVTGFYRRGEVVGQDYLSDDFETLVEVLARNGYETFGVSTNAHLTARTGFAQGFDVLAELWWEPAAAANEKALLLRDRLRAANPYFLWVHYFDPHAPYEAQEPWFSAYRRLRKDGGQSAPEGAALPTVGGLADFIDKYDSEINHVDASIRKLFAELDLESKSLVVITADHGEAFLEHATLTHGQSLFEEEIRVPLILHTPGQVRTQRVTSRVSLVDLYPTILDAVRVATPAGLAGVSLLPAIERGERTDRTIVTELDRDKRSERALIWGHWKLYRRAKPDTFARLFDLGTDPGERHDLSETSPQQLRALERLRVDWEKAWPSRTAPTKVAPFGEEQVERLRALGYL